MQRQKANVLLSDFSRFKSFYITASFLFALALLVPAANADPVDWTAYKKGFTISFPGYRGSTNYQVVRYNGSQYVHKLNAEQLATLSCNSITNVLPTALYVGNVSRSGSEAYSGKLDEIRISSVPRSDDWIQATFDSIMIPAAYSTAVQHVACTILVFR